LDATGFLNIKIAQEECAASVVEWSEFLAADLEVRVRFPALLRSLTQATEIVLVFMFGEIPV
jgi:hypothetical protein